MGEIYNIPAGIPFAKSLALQLLQEHEDDLSALADILILLPTRRACRTLREAFLQHNNGKPILLPRMQPIGDIDEEELSLSITGKNGTQDLLHLPPPITPLRRQILLARAIHTSADFPHSIDHAFALAKELGHLMDQIYTENLSLENLGSLVPEDFAAHWQVTLDFLKILSRTWPDILNDLDMIDAADRRNRLILALASFWQNHPPQTRIIAAGTTGSIPATAALLKTIADLPHSTIILPGLDQNCDDESWEVLEESHPQYGLKHLLEALNTPRRSVKDWSSAENETAIHRGVLGTEIMRPAETTKAWQTLRTNTKAQHNIKAALDNLHMITCETAQEEANIIGTLMRDILQHPEKTAALITPDRKLATRVTTVVKRWGITLDDSAGTPLSQTSHGAFILSLCQTCETGLSPVSLLSLLKHPFIAMDKTTAGFEEKILRGIKPATGFEGLERRIENLTCAQQKETFNAFTTALEEKLSPLLSLFEQDAYHHFETLLTTAIQTCESFTDSHILWGDETGNALSSLLATLKENAGSMPDMRGSEFTQILQQFLSSETLRPAYGTHPRLQILGQLEARLIDADLVIVSGLNEDTWPPKSKHDPWMSRPMRKDFGLPGSERSIGLAAHDFIQGFCTKNVVITRAKTQDGAPTIPARWLQRLQTVLDACSINLDTIASHPAQHWAQYIDRAETITPAPRPAPKPHTELRPKRMRITDIETWLKDPYSIYARHILKLEKLDPLEKTADAALRGQILHDTLDDFITAYPDIIPQNASAILHKTAQNHVSNLDQNVENWQGFWPRFTEISEKFLSIEIAWRENAAPLKTEIKGSMQLGDFTLYGRADRIDSLKEGYAIIDYKSGGYYSKSAIENGDTPQLPLEALISQNGGFEELKPAPCQYLGYWVLNPNAKNTAIEETKELLQQTQEALQTLITTFADENTRYHCIPRPDKIPRFHDYEHLARVKEWAALDEQEDAA